MCRVGCLFVFFFVISVHVNGGVEEVLLKSRFNGGIIVYLNCGDGASISQLRAGDAAIVQGLTVADAASVRTKIGEKHGRISVRSYDGRKLPYIDNLVNLLVAESLGDVTTEEAMRVLVPGGALCLKNGGDWSIKRKPRPGNIDEWTHFLHGPDNNPVAVDTVVGPPSRIQWMAGPMWSRNHEVTPSTFGGVTANGRIFFVEDMGPSGFYHEKLPPYVALVARDAFNGALLWRTKLPDWWSNRMKWLKVPDYVQRRLVAVGDRVYAVMGLDAPVTELDAATGRVVRTFKQTEHASEIVIAGGVLLVVSRNDSAFNQHYLLTTGDDKSMREKKTPIPQEGVVTAIDLSTGRTLWQKNGAPAPLTLAASAGRAFVGLGSELHAFDMKNGESLWTAKVARPGMVLAQPKVVIVVGGRNVAFDAESGKQLWTGKSSGRMASGYHSMPEAFVIDGAAWFGIAGVGYHLLTGKLQVKAKVAITGGHHHRCYMRKATSRYILGSKRGIEFIDVTGKKPTKRYDWVRGICRLGFVPANGLIYCPPNTCRCYTRSSLHGFYALGAAPPAAPDYPTDSPKRLVKGPTYGDALKSDSKGWVGHRGGPLRSGATDGELKSAITSRWTAELGARLSSPVACDGAVYVSVVDAYTVLRMDATSGKIVWRYLAGGRVETSPSIYKGLAIFGCADGCVYALDALTGTLRWRFRCAPADLQAGARGRLESVWPVKGVLVQNGLVYAAAGRNSLIDGGIALYGLDPATGAVNAYVHIADQPDAALMKTPKPNAYAMPGVNIDVLVGDGKNVYIRHVAFDGNLKALPKTYTPTQHVGYLRGTGDRLYASSGLLDDSMNNRAFWLVGQNYGNLMCFDSKKAYGVKVYRERIFSSVSFATRQWSLRWAPGGKGVLLYGAPVDVDPMGAAKKKRKTKLPTNAFFVGLNEVHDWQRQIKLVPKAMALAGDTLVYAGLPDTINTQDPYAAYEGRLGGTVLLLDTKTGKTKKLIKMKAAPAFDGLAIDNGRLFIVTSDGALTCFAD